MVCRIQKVGEHCLKLVVIKLCHRILQGIFNLHVGGGEETEHSQILIYFYPLQFSKIQFIWGSRQLTVIEQLHRLPVLPEAQNFLSVISVTSQKPSALPSSWVCNVLGVSNFYNSIFVLLCFVLVSPKTTSLLFLQYRWVWQHFRLNKHLSCQF